jgi:membrane-associated protein
MRLVTFLVADVVGAALLSGLVAGLGYALGQQAVDVVLAVDRYALWISLAIVVVVAVRAGRSPRGGAARSTPPAPDRG